MISSRRQAALRISAISVLALARLTEKAAARGEGYTDVAEAVEAFRKAMLADDKAEFESLCAAQMSYGHSAGKVQTKDEFITDAIMAHWKTLEFTDVKNSVAGENAISRFMLKGENESGGKLNAVNIGVLMVWQKQDGAWKLLARQAFRV
jgi:hypothetical protein